MPRPDFASRLFPLLAALSAGLVAASAFAQVASPQRKAGWWELTAHTPSGST